MRRDGIERMQPSLDAERRWTAHLDEIAESLMTRYGEAPNSWFTGANVPGKPRAFTVYFGGHNVQRLPLRRRADCLSLSKSAAVDA